ncbi:hypothetical protein [uncultured Alistipes sp.]|jgi:hypothetical protein|uniref:hypothetical protein n=1 Tax=uncultured Alistipes sp. TaxID=538949 RepID=UPI0025EE8506|nr:hypothetical protein [uncultured Alistipes sp.]
MKKNFSETIKRKPDEELAIISKDHLSYSEEERLVALNELQLRNNISEEPSVNNKKNESATEMPKSAEQAVADVQPTKRIYTDNMIWVATYLGGPLVAGYLIAENFKAFDQGDKAKITWITAIIGLLLISAGVSLIPDHVNIPNYIIPLSYTAIVYMLVKYYQGRSIFAHIESGGEPFGWWRAIVIGLIGCAITFALIFVFVFLFYSICSVIFDPIPAIRL